MNPYQPRNGSKCMQATVCLSLIVALSCFSSSAIAESYWVTVFDLQLQIGAKNTVGQQPPTRMLGGYLEMPREFSSWSCTAGEVYEPSSRTSTRYLECVSGRSTVYTQVTCQTTKVDNNSSSMILRNRLKTALFTLSCQSFVSDPGAVESGP